MSTRKESVLSVLRGLIATIQRDHADVLKSVRAFAGVADSLENRITALEKQMALMGSLKSGAPDGEPAEGARHE